MFATNETSLMNSTLGSTIKSIRSLKSISQNQLAEASGLTLRTIQRIETGETTPRGDSLLRIAAALNVSIQELTDSEMEENPGLNSSIVWSSVSFIAFPLLGFLIPLIVWLPKKGRFKGADFTASKVLNFQATILLIYILAPFIAAIYLGQSIDRVTIDANGVDGVLSPTKIAETIKTMALPILFLWFLNLIMSIVNGFRTMNGKSVFYPPSIPFIRR